MNVVESEYIPVESLEKSIRSLAGDILAVKPGGQIYIFSGESEPHIYGDEEFMDTVRHVLSPQVGAEINVLTSPILIQEADSHPFLVLKEEFPGKFKLRHRIVRGVDSHFRVVELPNGYLKHEEHPHRPLAESARLKCLNPNYNVTVPTLHFPAEMLISVFNAWVGHPEMTMETPVLATRVEISIFVAKAAELGKPFDYLRTHEIQAMKQAFSK